MIEFIIAVIWAFFFIGGILWFHANRGLLFYWGIANDKDLKIDKWARDWRIIGYIIKNQFKDDKKFSKYVRNARHSILLIIILIVAVFVFSKVY